MLETVKEGEDKLTPKPCTHYLPFTTVSCWVKFRVKFRVRELCMTGATPKPPHSAHWHSSVLVLPGGHGALLVPRETLCCVLHFWLPGRDGGV